jgi:spore germination protein GerM
MNLFLKSLRTVFIAGVFFYACFFSLSDARDLETNGEAGKEKTVVHLYFSDESNFFLKSEKRIFHFRKNPSDKARKILNSLIEGPRETDKIRTVPRETKIRGIYLTQNKTCYVDLTYPVADNHPGGCQTEMLTVFSIVNSLVLNMAEVDSVKILVDGKNRQTLAGHVDIRFPLKANLLIVR